MLEHPEHPPLKTPLSPCRRTHASTGTAGMSYLTVGTVRVEPEYERRSHRRSPRASHPTHAQHCLMYIVIERSRRVVAQAMKTSGLLAQVFAESQSMAYTSFGYSQLYGSRHWKTYTEVDCLCANFIRDVRLYPALNSHLERDTQSMCST